LGAAFLCAVLGITPDVREDHASYLDHWLTILKEDNRAIFSATAHAQRAADYLNDLQPKTKAGGVAAYPPAELGGLCRVRSRAMAGTVFTGRHLG